STCAMSGCSRRCRPCRGGHQRWPGTPGGRSWAWRRGLAVTRVAQDRDLRPGHFLSDTQHVIAPDVLAPKSDDITRSLDRVEVEFEREPGGRAEQAATAVLLDRGHAPAIKATVVVGFEPLGSFDPRSRIVSECFGGDAVLREAPHGIEKLLRARRR